MDRRIEETLLVSVMTDTPEFKGFSRKAIQFFKDLSVNNDRTWFNERKDEYKELILIPGQAFVIEIGERLKKISKEIQYDPRTNGRGSMFRIHRDVRFSKDKTPYDPRFRVFFWEGQAKKTDNPGFFFGMGPKGGQTYVGMHVAQNPVLSWYREAVADSKMGKALERAIAAVSNADVYEVGGEHYKRVPKGYDAEHPRADLLRYNGLWGQGPKLNVSALTKPDLVDVVFDQFSTMAPIQKWLVRLIASKEL